MSVSIREQVRVASDHSVHGTSSLLKPGTKAEVIVLVSAKPVLGKPYSAFDVMRENPIDAPEDYSTIWENGQRL